MPFFNLNDVFAGRYVLVELIGEGEASELWKAKNQLADDIVVVLKIYAAEQGMDNDQLQQSRQKFSLLQPVYHPHLLKAYQFDVWEGFPYMVMPVYSRESLSRMLTEEGPFSERQVAMVMSQIGSALAALHAHDPPIVHQDVRPDNIVASEPDCFLLADLGISSSTGRRSPKAYAPPESFEPGQKVTSAGDIFSLGVTVYEMCTKTLPRGESGGRAIEKEDDIPGLPAPYSAGLYALLQACMAANSNDRPGAEELHLRGKNFLATGQWTIPDKETKEVMPSNKNTPYILAAAVVLLLLIGAYWAYDNNHLPTPEADVRNMAATQEQEQEQNIDAMIIATLEDELEDLKKRTQELEEENRRLKGDDVPRNILEQNRDSVQEKEPQQAARQAQEPVVAQKQEQAAPRTPEPEAVIEEEEEAPISNQPQPEARPATNTRTVASKAETPPAAGPSTAPAKENTRELQQAIEQQLNKIADPKISEKERTAWKEETMAHFAEGGVRIVDETEGDPRQYSTSIFLNLLYRVPHTIEVKEVKSDQNKKITELRLRMQSKM